MDKNKFLIELSESTRTDFGKVEFSKQSAEQRVFSAIWALESEVNSGGFDCFFRYVETDVIAHAPVALKAIGALKCRTIVERAIAFIAPLPATEEGRGEALNALGAKGVEQLSKLDEEFYAYPDNLTSLLFDFVARHQPTFGAVPRT